MSPGTSIGTIFISYAHAGDAEWTAKLASDLERDGFSVFFDKWDIASGDPLIQSLDEGLNSASAGLIIFSRTTAESSWVSREYSALAQRMVTGGVRLIPVLRDDVALPPILSTQVIADFRNCVSENQYRSCLHDLERALRGQRPVRAEADGGIEFSRDMGRRPEGPRQVTLAVDREQVRIQCGTGEAVLRHEGPSHRVRERLWHVERIRRQLARVRREPGPASTAVPELGMHDLLLRLGQAMGEAFLAGPIGELLEAELSDADRQNAALRIALEICPDEELRTLPWETVCLSGHVEPLILQSRTELYHFVPGLGNTAAISIPGPLRILAVIASPEDDPRLALDYEAELDRIMRAVDRARRQERALVRVLDWGSAAAIRTALSEERYHILHISCQSSSDGLVLEKEDGSRDLFDAERFTAEVLVSDRGVPLIVLADGATSARPEAGSSGSALSHLAIGLLAHGVPAVLAMMSDVDDRYAIHLASRFYHALASRQQAPDPLAALSEARRELERSRAALPADDPGSFLAEWWMPALYLRTPPGPLFTPGSPGTVRPVKGSGRPLAGTGHGVDDFVGRRTDLRKLLGVLRGDHPAVVIYGIGGMGKTSLARRLINALGEEIELVLFIPGRTTPTEILQELGNRLRPLCLKWNLDPAHELSQAAHELRDPRQDWTSQMELVKDIVLAEVSVLLVLDEAEQNMRDAGQGPPGDSPGELTDPELALFIVQWTGLGAERTEPGSDTRPARLLVTSRYPIALADEVSARVTLHHLGPLSRAETGKLMWRLPALDALRPDERDRAYADVGGHPRALEYLDALLHGQRARFADVADRMEAALRNRGIADPSRWLASGVRDLNRALAETATLIVDDVLVDRLVIRLQSFPLALKLFVAASVFRTPVDAMGLNWAVAESLGPGPDPDREARVIDAYTRLAAAQEASSAFTLEQLDLPAGLLAQLQRDCAAGSRPEERAGLARAIEALLDMSLLSQASGSPASDPQYLVHRWTAQGLRSLVQTGMASLVDPAELTEAHRRAAAYYEWRADVWPDAVADLLEARHHYQQAGEHQSAAAVSMRAAAILFRWGAFNQLRRLCAETRAGLGGVGIESCELLYWQSRAAQAQGDLDSADGLCREALALARQLDDTRWTAMSLERLASIAADHSAYDAALRDYHTALDLARELSDAVIEARCYQGIGAVALAKGNDDEAKRWSQGALNSYSGGRLRRLQMIIDGRRQLAGLARALGDTETASRLIRSGFAAADDLEQIAGQSQLQIGTVALRRDDLGDAEAAFTEARRIAERSRNLVMRKDCYLQLGLIFQRRGALSLAQESYQRYIDLADDMGDRPGTVNCYHQMGELAEARGDLAGAAGWNEQALKLAAELGQPRLVAEAHGRLARASLAQGDLAAAEASYLRSAAIGEQHGDPQILVSSRLGLAAMKLQSGELTEAEEIYRDGRQIAKRNHDQAGVARSQMGLAAVARERGDYDDASHLFKQAFENVHRMGNQTVASDCLIELGDTAVAEGEPALAATTYYAPALKMAEGLKDGRKIAELCHRLAGIQAGGWARFEWYQRAAQTYDAYGYPLSAARLWLVAGRFAAGLDLGLGEASTCCRHALDLVGQEEGSPVGIEAWLETARCFRKRGERRQARDAWRHVTELAERAGRDDLIGLACQEGGLISQLAGDAAGARALHRQALDLAERADDQDTMIASCRDLGRLARWEGDNDSVEYWYGRALGLAEQGGDDLAAIACAQQLLLAAIRAGDAGHAAGLATARPVLVGRLDEHGAANSVMAGRRGRLGAELTIQSRPDEALGFTAASLLAWHRIDRTQADQQRDRLQRQRAELGDDRFTSLLAEYADGDVLEALLEISLPAAGTEPDADGVTGSGDADHGQADDGEDAQHG